MELPDPSILHSTDVIVEVAMAGLCGSDLHPYFGREKGLDPHTVMGHELVGHIVEAGRDVKSLIVGDRVYAPFTTNCGQCFYCERGLTCRCELGELFGWVENGKGLQGCQSQFVRVPLAEATLMQAPDGLSNEAALLLADNFSTGYFCAEMAEVRPQGVYAVIGCGNVGQMAIVAAKSLGAEKLIAIDPVEDRRQAALLHGETSAVHPDDAAEHVNQSTDGRGADGVMELVGLPAAQSLAYELLRPAGIMSVVGCHCSPQFSFSPVDAFDKNLNYRTGRCPARHYMDRLTDSVVARKFQLDSFVTHRYALDDCVQAYDVFSKRQDGCVKAVFVV